MRIGIDARMLGFSGIGRYTENLIRQLLKIDQKNQYIVFIQKGQKKSTYNLPAKSYKLIRVDAPIYSIKEQVNFLEALNQAKLDLMHFTHFNRPIFYTGPSVVTIHDLTPIYFPGKRHGFWLKQAAYRLVLKNALKKATKIIAVSNYTKRDIIRHFPFTRGKIEVIYEGTEEKLKAIIKKSKLIPNSQFPFSAPYLLYVGVWREHKNLVGLIRAFEKLKSLPPKSCPLQALKLVISGKPDPYYPEVKEIAKKSRFKKDIILTGYVSDKELARLYQNAQAFVFPSFYEGFGLPPLEAMAALLPVVSSNQTSLPEVLGEAAVYFDPKKPDNMAQKIEKVLQDKKLRADLIKKGKIQVKKYSFQKMAAETLRVYNKIKEIRT